MKFCYQVATPDVAIAPSVTAYQGSLEETFSAISAYGYDGVELMTIDPKKLSVTEIKATAEKYSLAIPLVCTGEVYGQLGLSFGDPDENIRETAVTRLCEIIDFAGELGANINLGRSRGLYRDDTPRELTYSWALDGMRRLAARAEKAGVIVALETVTIMQTNFINTIAEAAKVVDEIESDNFRLMMDVFHLNIEERDMFAVIRDFAAYNIHVHLADNNRRYPGHCGMDFERVIHAFYDVGYDGAFCTEIFQIPDQGTAARGAMEHLAPIFERVYSRPVKR